MDQTDKDDDLELVKASTELLADLETRLPLLLWKAAKTRSSRHIRANIKQSRLDRVLALIEPFQSEPQLLDTKLKTVLPPIVDAYVQYLTSPDKGKAVDGYIDVQSAACSLLYTLCKVRGHKVIVGFLNNEPRYLEPILETLEHAVSDQQTQWQVPYVLLLWLSHLLLTPFDLSSISARPTAEGARTEYAHLPPLMLRILLVGQAYLYAPTKAQAAAATLLCRLCRRPDVQELHLADALIREVLDVVETWHDGSHANVYELLGSLRFIAGVAASAELAHLMPGVFDACARVFIHPSPTTASSHAVAKKTAIKILRSIALSTLRHVPTCGPLMTFAQTTNVLEDVVDYLLQSLGDKDAPVRYAAAKAVSLIVADLEAEMGYQIIQAILDMLQEDRPRSSTSLDFSTANALKWHGLTLALAQTLFKRSASPGQLQNILDALLLALQFQQRTATGSVLGTSVRDAANFGIWSLARRYTTAELSLVQPNTLPTCQRDQDPLHPVSIVQVLAIELILSACLDPAGNIRRGSSAALQELVGRHPDQIYNGIALVQIVEFLAVGLRHRAMVDVAHGAAALHQMYWWALLNGLLGWRGLGSIDAASRQSAATSIAGLSIARAPLQGRAVLTRIIAELQDCPTSEIEALHGYNLALASMMLRMSVPQSPFQATLILILPQLWSLFELHPKALQNFSPRILRSEYPLSLAKYISALCSASLTAAHDVSLELREAPTTLNTVDVLTEQLLTRHEAWLLPAVPDLTRNLSNLKYELDLPLTCINLRPLIRKVETDGNRSTLYGSARAIALGSLLTWCNTSRVNDSDLQEGITGLERLIGSTSVDWRVLAVHALQLVVESLALDVRPAPGVVEQICRAVHGGLNDYTIDERGDVGSLVRLQSIACASNLLAHREAIDGEDAAFLEPIQADIYRLSLERLDRVRLQASLCRKKHLTLSLAVIDAVSITSPAFFAAALEPLGRELPDWKLNALLRGCVSCAGTGDETVMSASRHALAVQLSALDDVTLARLLSCLSALLSSNSNPHPALEVVGFLLDMQILQRLDSQTFKWRALLISVQRSHHKSTDLPRLLAAVHAYRGLVDVPTIRAEVLKKLLSMVKTNPYPRVRVAVAEALWMLTGEQDLKRCDFTKTSTVKSVDVMRKLQIETGA